MEGILQWLVYLVYGVWLSGITYLLLRALANYNRLTKGADSKTLSQILNDLLNQEQLTQGQLKQIGQDITGLKKYKLLNLNKLLGTNGVNGIKTGFTNRKHSFN